MNNAVLIQHAYDGEFQPMMELTKERHAAYCERFGFDFWHEIHNKSRPMETGGWAKIELMQKALSKGYEYIVWLDADALIYDVEVNLREAIQRNKIGACWHRIPQLYHWNAGVLYLHNSVPVQNVIDNWWASYPPPKDGWFEQGVFNRIGKENNTIVTISDRWNATIDVNMVPDAVVLGFHGQSDAKGRYEMMLNVMNKISTKEAETTQDEREVINGC